MLQQILHEAGIWGKLQSSIGKENTVCLFSASFPLVPLQLLKNIVCFPEFREESI